MQVDSEGVQVHNFARGPSSVLVGPGPPRDNADLKTGPLPTGTPIAVSLARRARVILSRNLIRKCSSESC